MFRSVKSGDGSMDLCVEFRDNIKWNFEILVGSFHDGKYFVKFESVYDSVEILVGFGIT